MKQLTLYLILVLVILVNPTSAELLKVGVIIPLSGPLSSYGVATRQGFELAVTQNPAGYKDVKFLYEDSQYDGKASVAAFRKLIERDQVNLLYVWGVLPSEVIAPLAKAAKMPTILYTLDKRIHEHNPWIVRTQATPDQFGRALSDYLAKHHLKNLAIFKVQLAYYTAMYEGLESSLREDQSIITVENFAPDQMDFKSNISKLKGRTIDAIGIYMIPGQIAQLYRQLSEQGLKLSVFGTEDIGTHSEIEKAPALIEGSVFAMNAVAASFEEPYKNLYGSDTNIGHAAHAYDIARYLLQIPKGSATEMIIETFRMVPLQAGVLGMPIRTSAANGGVSFTFPVALGMVKNGAVIPLS